MASPMRSTPLLVGVAALCVLCPLAQAQRRIVAPLPIQSPHTVIHPSTAIVPMQAPHVVMQTPHAMTPAHVSTRAASNMRPAGTSMGHSGHSHHGFNSVAPLGNCISGLSGAQLVGAFPTNGFTFQHQNAINGDLALKAAIDPATQFRVAEASRLSCGAIGTGGFFVWDGGYGMQEAAAEEPAEPAAAPAPQVIVLQEPQPAQAAHEVVPAVPAHVEEDAPPLRDEGQFVLVMRDGSQLQAVAFMRSAESIIYITPDGMRHSVSLADVDSQATIRVNGERGTGLQSSL